MQNNLKTMMKYLIYASIELILAFIIVVPSIILVAFIFCWGESRPSRLWEYVLPSLYLVFNNVFFRSLGFRCTRLELYETSKISLIFANLLSFGILGFWIYCNISGAIYSNILLGWSSRLLVLADYAVCLIPKVGTKLSFFIFKVHVREKEKQHNDENK